MTVAANRLPGPDVESPAVEPLPAASAELSAHRPNDLPDALLSDLPDGRREDWPDNLPSPPPRNRPSRKNSNANWPKAAPNDWPPNCAS
jgi:hypothetical protein